MTKDLNKNKVIYSKSEARKNFPKILDMVCDNNSSVYVYNRGVPQAVIISMKEYSKYAIGNLIKKEEKNNSFESLEAIGMWKDREDMKDSVKWVNDLRKREGSSDYEL